MGKLKERLEGKKYIVVCDTNVWLNIYRYSPEFSDFSLKCMKEIKDYIILPSTVRLEYLKHYRASFGTMRKKVNNASCETRNQIITAKRKILNTCDTLETFHYPDISELRNSLDEKFRELEKILEDFFEDRNILEFISLSWGNNDYVYKIVGELTKNGQLMPPVTQENIYQICEDGEKRYKNNPPIPPGFKDAKNKDGVRKYSDLILWKEIMSYAKTRRVNVILVTDDKKSDWWLDNNGVIEFHPHLLKEFREETGMELLAFSSSDFYEEVSKEFDIEKTDAIEIALRITDEDYFVRISEDVFDSILDELSLSGDTYIETFSSHIGTEGIDELEITDHELVEAKQVYRDETNITYCLIYSVEAEATSFDYWGRDDDTKEIILSPGAAHEFKGTVEVEVVREADVFLDFEADSGFESVKIIRAVLQETKYEPYMDYDEPLDGAYNTCPDCGCEINFDNDGGNGFCSNCAWKH